MKMINSVWDRLQLCKVTSSLPLGDVVVHTDGVESAVMTTSPSSSQK
jgi:hypothetical protein